MWSSWTLNGPEISIFWLQHGKKQLPYRSLLSLLNIIDNTNCCWLTSDHDSDVIMGAMASQITSLTIVYRLFRSRSKKTSKLRVTGHCAGNSPVTGEFPAQMTSNAENVSIWWRHHVIFLVKVSEASDFCKLEEGEHFIEVGNDKMTVSVWLSPISI